MKKRVVIGMSGGVDSSVAAYLLKEQGYEVYGITFSFTENFTDKNSNEDFEDAKSVCTKLNIPLKIINIFSHFKKVVIDYFVEEYNLGATPSPCIICDEKIKFYFLNEYAKEVGAHHISTGHYAQVEFSEDFNLPLLKVSKDKRKDQSYMLYRLNNDILPKLIFPLFKYNKSEVREIAKNLELKIHDKKDSQGICFAKEGYIPFLKNSLKEKIVPGNFIFEDGTVIGTHEGFQLYTIGQRRGLNIKLPRAYFITKINPLTNEITLGEYSELMRDVIEITQCHFSVSAEKLLNLPLVARPRFSSSGLEGTLSIVYDSNHISYPRYFFKFNTPTPQNAPGQHLVFYFKDFVVGGGKIIF